MNYEIQSNRAELSEVSLHYLTAGDFHDVSRETIVLIHGVPQTSHEWRQIISGLVGRYNVVAPDLRGPGDTSRPVSGYDKRTVAADVWELVHDKLGLDRIFLVGHDWGGAVAFALAASHPGAVHALAILDVTIPGDGAEMSQGGRRWHHPFFRIPDLPEALCAGREHLIIDWLFDNYGHHHNVISDEDRAEYHRTYSKLGGFRALISYYRAFDEDARHNAEIIAKNGKLKMPVLALGGDKSYGRGMETMRSLLKMADSVKGGLIPNCGHWVAEEAPEFITNELVNFFSDVDISRQ